jgi:predicted nucleic acid-binding Zn ribbon protein
MPTYEYRCPEGHESEDFVLKISDAKTEVTAPHERGLGPRL